MSCQRALSKGLSLFVVVVLAFSTARPQTSVPGWGVASAAGLKGDVTGDGFVNGKDALRLMRIAEGLTSATPNDLDLGDVYPFPGSGGRTTGDGQLTREDALQILRYAAGLIAYSELGGQSTPPVIGELRPSSGKASDEVVIVGEQFIAGQPGENAVDFGGLPAEILNAGATEIRSRVPAGAVSGPVTVRTPGGRSVSNGDFVVPASRPIQMNLPSGLSAGAYTIVNRYGQGRPNASGQASVPASSERVTLNTALPVDGTKRTFFYVDALESPPGEAVIMDAASTAKAIVFLSPYLFTSRLERVQTLFATMRDDPKVVALAQVIAQVYPQVPNPLDDSRMVTALREAIISVAGRLPAEYFVTLRGAIPSSRMMGMPGQSGAAAAKALPLTGAAPLTHGDAAQLPLYWKPIDPNILQYSADSPGKLKVEPAGENPLDWVGTIYKLDPTQFYRGLQSIDEVPTIPGDVTLTNANLSFRRLAGEEPKLVVPASLFFDNLDLLEKAVDLVTEIVKEAAPGPPAAVSRVATLAFDGGHDGVYEVRMVNPALIWMWGFLGSEWGFIPNSLGHEDALDALEVNVIMAVLDGLNVLVDIDEVVSKEFVIGLFQKAKDKIRQEFPNGLQRLSDAAFWTGMTRVLLLTLLDGMKLVAETAAGKFAEDDAIGAHMLSALFDFTGKISNFGQFGERTAYLATGTGLGFAMSPLESLILVVGDPFSPRITGFSPLEGVVGDMVTITGQRFRAAPGENVVQVGEWNAVVRSVVEFDPGNFRLTAEVAANARPGEWRISVATPAGRGQSQGAFRVKRKPVITGVTPDRGFTPRFDFPSAGQSFRGTRVVIEGAGFDRDADVITMGGVPVPRIKISITESSWSRIVLNVPDGAASGPVEITTPEGLKGAGPQFTVLGPPVVQQKTLKSAIGALLIVPVSNLGDSAAEVSVELSKDSYKTAPAALFVHGRDRLAIRVPLAMLNGQVTVITPAGSDNGTFSFSTTEKAFAGTLRPNPGKDDLGSDPRHLSLREAVAAAAGAYVLWDDEDDEVIRYKSYERKNAETGEIYWVDVLQEEPPLPAPGPGKGHLGHEFRRYFKERHFLDGTTDRIEIGVKDLDSSADQDTLPEEADMLESSIPNYVPGANTIDRLLLERGDGLPGKTYLLTMPGVLKLGLFDDVDMAGSSGRAVIDATAMPDGQVLFELRDSNGLINAEIRNAPSVAILMGEGAHDNLVKKIRISGVRGTGIQIGPGSYANEVNGSEIAGMRVAGILISGQGTNRNKIVGTSIGGYLEGQTYVFDGSDTGWGVVISDGASNNMLDGGYSGAYNAFVTDNRQGGILITGVATDHNQVRGYNIGFATRGTYSTESFSAGNGGDGIRISGGAKYNYIGDLGDMQGSPGGVSLGFNQGDGLVITGAGTTDNVVYSMFALTTGVSFFASQPDQGNAGNGLRISDGASRNRIENFFSQNNGGYAVLIEGLGTDSNVVTQGTLGGKSPGQGVALKGLGGAAIRNGAKGNEVSRCMIGGTTGDAVLVSNAGDQQQPNKVWNNTIGAYKTWNPQTQQMDEVQWSDGRSGIRLEAGARYNVVDMNRVNFEPTGIALTGAGTNSNRLRFNRLKNSQFTGILLSDTADSNFVDSTLVYRSGQDGVVVDNADRTSLLTVLVRESGRDGVVLANGSDNTIIDSLIPPATFVPTPDPFEMPESPIDVSWTEVSGGVRNGIVVGPSARNTIVRGAAIFGNNGGDGILVVGPNTSSVEITGNYIGVSRSKEGALARAGNQGNGVRVFGASGVLVGGATRAQGNTIAANTLWGVRLWGSSNVQVLNNLIGTDVAGSQPWGNGGGISLEDASLTAIGGAGAGNLISGNSGNGVDISGSGSLEITVVNNFIGVNLAGDAALGNTGDGIRASGGASRVFIGRDSDGFRNVISGNTGSGIHILHSTTSNLRVEGNLIGADAAGGTALGNKGGGVLLDNGATNIPIGPGNTISGNGFSGILVTGAGTNSNSIFGNWIGLNGRRQPLGNQSNGVSITNGASRNRLYRNFIWNNAGDGVSISTNAGRNTVSGSSITRNGGQGIRLTSGGNSEIPAPWIVSSRSGLIQGQVADTIPERSTVEVFADSEDEGMLSLGTTQVSRGNFILRVPVPAGARVTARVTTAPGDTSQFGGPGLPRRPPPVPLSRGPTMLPESVIVYTSNWGGNSDIFVQDSFADQGRRITTAPEADYSPALSPDGKKIAFVSERDGNPEVYTMGVDGSNPLRVTNVPAPDYDPVWSPDGGSIAFVSERDGNPEIYIMSAGGATPTRLTTDAAIDRYPAWSHDGTRIAFVSYRPGNAEVYVLDVATTAVTRLTNEPAADSQPAWSPDDQRLVFVSERTGKPELHIMNRDGTGVTRLTDNQSVEAHPAWLNGAEWIAFQSNLDGAPEIYAMTSNGLDLRRLTVTWGTNTEPDWAPRGGAAGPGSVPGGGTPPVQEAGAVNSGAAALKVRIESRKASPGATVSLGVTVDGAQNLGSLAFSIAYDESRLKLTGAAPGAMVQVSNSLFVVNPETFPSSAGFVRFNMVRAAGFNGAGEILRLAFQVDPAAKMGDVGMTFQIVNACDVNVAAVPIAWQNGVLTIDAGLGGDVNKDRVVDIFDLAQVAAAFNARAGDSRFNASADVTRDGAIDIHDLVGVGMNFGAAAP
ncbi:MAG: PD40 domain-containing protein [Chloroflexi bacterium]|nr:PD40 domain-containing protein [Chloroflexota bacterium]